MNTMRFVCLILVMSILCGCNAPVSAADAEQVCLQVPAISIDSTDVPVCATIELPEQFAKIPAEQICVTLTSQADKNLTLPGQVVTDAGKTQLWWILPHTGKNAAGKWIASFTQNTGNQKNAFHWQDKKGEYLDLLFDGRKVTRYMYAYDNSTPQRLFQTYKPFLNIFDLKGEKLITNNGEPNTLYPHHRGLMLGWMKTDADGRKYDFWHMKAGVQKHIKFTELTAGPVLARSTALVNWEDTQTGKPVIIEQRQTTVFRQSSPAILLLDFDTELKAVDSNVTLDGDSEHAGFQFRAHNDIAKGPNDLKAVYLFPDRKINPHKDFDIPWVGMSYGLNGKRYSVEYINSPDNPKPSVYSAYRDYGRFGACFKKQISAGQTLKLSYQVWIAENDMPAREQLAARYETFTKQIKAEVINNK